MQLYSKITLESTADKGEINLSPRGSLSVVCMEIRVFCIFKIPNIEPRSRYSALQPQPRICVDDANYSKRNTRFPRVRLHRVKLGVYNTWVRAYPSTNFLASQTYVDYYVDWAIVCGF